MIFGRNFTNVVTQNGTTGSDVLAGTAAVDVLIGGQGADTLIGNGGADVLRGGEGDDILAVSDMGFAKIAGGSDTLRLDAASITLDLTTIPDNRITGIETLDITGSGANALTLNVQEVLNLSDESNTLIVQRDDDDTINLGLGWTLTGSEVIGLDTFDVYTQSAATLKVAQTISIPLDGDLNGDGFVGVDDLNIVLINWNQNAYPLVIAYRRSGSPLFLSGTAHAKERGSPALLVKVEG